MLTSLIKITPAAHRRGANQMRQQLSFCPHFRRGNAILILIVAVFPSRSPRYTPSSDHDPSAARSR
jgi:hypothetical protein